MNSGTWEQEMDAYESIFKGMTISEVKDWVAKYCSDLNGRALHSTCLLYTSWYRRPGSYAARRTWKLHSYYHRWSPGQDGADTGSYR